MDREKYNNCMRPYIRGKDKSKEERQKSFCIGAKVCSGKAKNEKEAEYLCSLPKEPKIPKVRKSAKQLQAEQDACNLPQFQEIISQFNHVYLDVNSPRCAPCHELDQLIKEAEIPYQIVQIPENCLEIIDYLGIESFPTVIKMEKGKVTSRHTMGPQDTIGKMKKGL